MDTTNRPTRIRAHSLLKIALLLYSCIAFFVTPAKATTPNLPISRCILSDNGDSGFEDIVRIIKNRECRVNSIDSFLKILPESIRSRFVLFYRSQSLQGPHKVNYQNPRAILSTTYDKNADRRLQFSFNGDSSLPGYLNLEVLEIDMTVPNPDENIFRYFDIKFPDEESVAGLNWEDSQELIEISKPNPKQCTICHGTPARPIFQSYPKWKGAYGARHLKRDSPQVEKNYKAFKNFVAESTISRYRHLKFNEKAIFASRDYQNNYFNISLSVPNFTRVARIIQKTPFYNEYKSAILAAGLDCPNFEEYIPDNIKSQLDRNLNERFQLTKKINAQKVKSVLRKFHSLGPEQFGGIINMGEESDIYLSYPRIIRNFETFQANQLKYWNNYRPLFKLWIQTAEPQGPHRSDPNVAKLRYIFEGRGLNMDNWFLDLKKSTYRFSDGYRWTEGLALALAKEDPSLYSFYNDYYLAKRETNNKIDLAPFCKELKEKSFTLLKGSKDTVPLLTRKKESFTEKSGFPATFSKACAKCHTDEDIGPVIPFNNDSEFKRWYRWPRNKKLLNYRLNTDHELDRMPLLRELKIGEKKAIDNYLDEIENQSK